MKHLLNININHKLLFEQHLRLNKISLHFFHELFVMLDQ